jgi:hypothetical protein
METLFQPEKVLKNTEILRWALANRRCKITEAPHWLIMALLEDIVLTECHLIEQLVKALDEFQDWVTEDGYLERSVERLMNNVLLASLHEDGHISDSCGLLNEVYLFEFHNGLNIQIDLAPFEQGVLCGEHSYLSKKGSACLS